MASIAEFIFIPIVVVLIGGMIAMVSIFDIEAESNFEKETDQAISTTLIHSVASTIFHEQNSEGVGNYRALSYRICNGPTSRNNRRTEFSTEPEQSISGIIEHIRIKVTGIPSQCSSASNYDGETLYGTNTIRNRDYTYAKKVPVLGGDVAEVNFVYEIE